MNYEDFKKENRHTADQLVMTKDEIYNLYLFCEYSGGVVSKEEGKRIAGILAR